MRKNRQMSKLQQKSLKNKILQNHAGWLWGHKFYKEAMECIDQAGCIQNQDVRQTEGYSKRRRNDRSNAVGDSGSPHQEQD